MKDMKNSKCNNKKGTLSEHTGKLSQTLKHSFIHLYKFLWSASQVLDELGDKILW
jgi:hypothetical protein